MPKNNAIDAPLPLSVEQGGTGAESAAEARENLGVDEFAYNLKPTVDNLFNLGNHDQRWAFCYLRSILTGRVAGNTTVLSSWDTDASAYNSWIVMTAGDPPTCELLDGVIATTQAPDDNSRLIATTEYVDAAVSGITGVTELDELDDVNIDNPQDDEVLTYENGEWVNKAAGGGGEENWVPLTSVEADGDSSLDFDQYIDDTYETYVLGLSNLIPSANSLFGLRMSTDGGQNYIASNASYTTTAAWGTTHQSSSSLSYTSLNGTNNLVSTNTERGMSGYIYIHNAASDTRTKLITAYTMHWSSSSFWARISFGGAFISTDPINAIRLFPVSGNFASGKVTLYGIKG